MCKCSANFAYDKATYGRTNRYKTRDVVKTSTLAAIKDEDDDVLLMLVTHVSDAVVDDSFVCFWSG